MGKPSKGTPADKRLKANKSGGGGSSKGSGSSSTKSPFGGKRAAPFGKGGVRKR